MRCALGGAQGTAQTDLAAPFEHPDQHDVADADRSNQQRDGAQAQEEAVEGPFGFGPSDQCCQGWDTSTSPGFSGFAVAPSTESTARPGWSAVRTYISERVTVEAQVFLGRREADQEDCRSREPSTAGFKPGQVPPLVADQMRSPQMWSTPSRWAAAHPAGVLVLGRWPGSR